MLKEHVVVFLLCVSLLVSRMVLVGMLEWLKPGLNVDKWRKIRT